MSTKQLEIGYVTLESDGVIVHVQHSIFKNQLDDLRRSRNTFNITPGDYIWMQFKRKKAEILSVLVEHFELQHKAKECIVSFLRRLDGGLSPHTAADAGAGYTHMEHNGSTTIELAETRKAEELVDRRSRGGMEHAIDGAVDEENPSERMHLLREIRQEQQVQRQMLSELQRQVEAPTIVSAEL